MKKLFFCLALLTFLACNASTLNEAHLQGIWANNEEENALFAIEGKRIHYTENLEALVSFELKKDTLIVNSDGFVSKNLILKLSEDSLVLKPEFGSIVRLYKRK